MALAARVRPFAIIIDYASFLLLSLFTKMFIELMLLYLKEYNSIKI